MDNIWIFLIIAGAIASFAQKGQNKRPQASGKQEDDEMKTPQESPLERRLRELIENSEGRGSTEPFGPSQGDMHPSTDNTQPTRHVSPAQYVQPTQKRVAVNVSPQSNATNQLTEKRKQVKFTTNKAHATNPIKESEIGSKSEIEAILDDFSMEKAVIYSEILKPKYEEF